MGRGLSAMQKQILDTLPYRGPSYSSLRPDQAMRPVEILAILGLPNTNANRASISRSLAALWRRARVLKWGADVALQGSGYRYTKAHSHGVTSRALVPETGNL